MKQLILLLILVLGTSSINAQQIYGTKYTVETNEYGNWYLVVTPNQFHGNVAKTTKTEGVYAVMLCYSVKGKQTQKYNDCTKDFVVNGEKRYYLASSYKKRSDIVINKVVFFRKDEPRENWPKKECY